MENNEELNEVLKTLVQNEQQEEKQNTSKVIENNKNVNYKDYTENYGNILIVIGILLFISCIILLITFNFSAEGWIIALITCFSGSIFLLFFNLLRNILNELKKLNQKIK